VAAIGGIMQRVLDPLMTEMSLLPYEGKLRRLASAVDMGREKLQRAVKFVEARNDGDYFDLMARRLCDMETQVLCGYLMLRHALKDKGREAAAERYILDTQPLLAMHYEVITSGDFSLIDNREAILAL